MPYHTKRSLLALSIITRKQIFRAQLAEPAVGDGAATFLGDRREAKALPAGSLWKTVKSWRSRASSTVPHCASLSKIDLLTMSTPGVGGRCRNCPVVERPRLALGPKATSEAEGTGG